MLEKSLKFPKLPPVSVHPVIVRVLERAARGQSMAAAAAAEGVALTEGVELDAYHDGKPVCPVRPSWMIGGTPVFVAEDGIPATVVQARRQSLARALGQPVCFLETSSWVTVTP